MILKFRSKKYSNPTKNIGSSEFEVDNWIVSDFVLDKLVPIVGVRPYPLNELMLMTAAVCRFKPDLIFEWGTHFGKSARIFYEVTKAFNIPCKVHSIDLPDDAEHVEHPHQERGVYVRKVKDVALHQGDGLKVSLEIYKKSKNKRVLFFLDGDHSYETVKKELTSILKAVPDAVILLHDTFYQDAKSKYNIGPYQVIQDVLHGIKGSYRLVRTNTGLPGMTVVFAERLLQTQWRSSR